MKPLLSALLLLSLLPALPAQDVPIDPSGALVTDVRLTREQLKELTGPIALYPDPLVAMILPASTFPSDVVLAARFVTSDEDPALADEKPWDESIRGLTRYPDVLTWMDENLEWTSQLGYAYLAQPEDVMESIQELRAQAQTVGNLVDTPQQRVVREETYIRIVPAEPEYIYVPYYDPEIVYYERPVAEPYITFSSPWLVGTWLTFDFDWHRNRLYCGDWHGDWDYRHRGDRHDHRGESLYINNSFSNYEVWHGDSRRRMGSARNFEVNRERLRQSSFSRPTSFHDRFDVNERERRAVAVRADVRERDRRDAVGEVSRRDLDRTKFGNDGRLRNQAGERATLSKIADREKDRIAVETKRREEYRARFAAEGKISRDRERGRDGRSPGADGKMRDGERTPDGVADRDGKGTGADGKMRDGDRTTPGGVADRDRDGKGTGADGKMRDGDRTTPGGVADRDRDRDGKAPGADGKMRDGERGKAGPDGRMTERPTIPGEAPRVGAPREGGERGKMGDSNKGEGERGKGGVEKPRNAPPTVPGEMRPDKAQSDSDGKGKGKGRDADRGPSGRPEMKDIPKAEPATGRPETKGMPKAAPAPAIPGESGKRGNEVERSRGDERGKGREAPPTPRMDTPRAERPSAPKTDPAPKMTPRPSQDAPKPRPQPPVNVAPPKPKAQPSVPSTQPQERKKERDSDKPSARRNEPRPSAPVAERKSPPKPPVAAPRPEPQRKQKPVAAAPRPTPSVKPAPQAAPPKPQASGGGKKPKGDPEKKKDKK